MVVGGSGSTAGGLRAGAGPGVDPGNQGAEVDDPGARATRAGGAGHHLEGDISQEAGELLPLATRLTGGLTLAPPLPKERPGATGQTRHSPGSVATTWCLGGGGGAGAPPRRKTGRKGRRRRASCWTGSGSSRTRNRARRPAPMISVRSWRARR